MAYMSQEKKATIAPAVKALLTTYGLKGSLSVHHHSMLILTIKSGKVDFFSEGAVTEDVNHHYIDRNFTGTSKEVLTKLRNAMMDGNHNNNDIQSDYFDVGWYISIKVGQWDRPYVKTGG